MTNLSCKPLETLAGSGGGLLIVPYNSKLEFGAQVPIPTDAEEPQIRDTLTHKQKKQVSSLVKAFPKTFRAQSGQTTLMQHTILTVSRKIISENTWPLLQRMRETVEEEVQAMIELGVTEESQSECHSPIILVLKPDETLRFCIDFRRMEAISKLDAYLMPWVDELFDWLGDAHYITTLDLTKGYWQILLDPISKEKMAFATPVGLYQFTGCPSGSMGLQSPFQHFDGPHPTTSWHLCCHLLGQCGHV